MHRRCSASELAEGSTFLPSQRALDSRPIEQATQLNAAAFAQQMWEVQPQPQAPETGHHLEDGDDDSIVMLQAAMCGFRNEDMTASDADSRATWLTGDAFLSDPWLTGALLELSEGPLPAPPRPASTATPQQQQLDHNHRNHHNHHNHQQQPQQGSNTALPAWLPGMLAHFQQDMSNMQDYLHTLQESLNTLICRTSPILGAALAHNRLAAASGGRSGLLTPVPNPNTGHMPIPGLFPATLGDLLDMPETAACELLEFYCVAPLPDGVTLDSRRQLLAQMVGCCAP